MLKTSHVVEVQKIDMIWRIFVQQLLKSEDSQGLFDLLKKDSSRSRECDVFMFSQPVSERKVLSEKVEEMEGVQALERDRLVSMNKMIETRTNELESLQ